MKILGLGGKHFFTFAKTKIFTERCDGIREISFVFRKSLNGQKIGVTVIVRGKGWDENTVFAFRTNENF
jgi:hypothetical protein